MLIENNDIQAWIDWMEADCASVFNNGNNNWKNELTKHEKIDIIALSTKQGETIWKHQSLLFMTVNLVSFKDFTLAKRHKADLMKNGISAGIDKAKTDLF